MSFFNKKLLLIIVELSILFLLGLVQFSSQKEKKKTNYSANVLSFYIEVSLAKQRQQTPIKWECFPQTTLIKKAQILFAVLLV